MNSMQQVKFFGGQPVENCFQGVLNRQTGKNLPIV